MKASRFFLCFCVFLCFDLFAKQLSDEDIEKLELFKLSNQIRGSNYECEGYKYIKSLQAYQKKLLKALNEPEQVLNESIFSSEQSYKNSLEYFKYWGLQSIGNHRLYSEFIKAKDDSLKLFEEILGDKKYSLHFIQMFEKRAFGEIDNFKKLDELYKIVELEDALDLEAYIVKNGVDIFELTKALQVSLLVKKNVDFLKVLLKYGAKINAGYESAVFFALDYPKGLMFLIENKADVNYENFFGKTPLFYAVENDNLQVAKILLDNGALVNKDLISINELDFVGAHLPYYMKTCSFIHGNKNVFMHASSYASENMLKLLISYGAKYDVVDDLGFNALDFALNDNNEKVIEYLKSLGLAQNRQIEPEFDLYDTDMYQKDLQDNDTSVENKENYY